MAVRARSLRVQVLAAIAAGAVVLVALFAWMGSSALDRFLTGQADSRLLGAGHRSAAFIDRVAADRQREVEVVATHPSVLALFARRGDSRALAELARMLDFAEITLVTPNGDFVARHGAGVSFRGDSAWWERVSQDGVPVASAQPDSASSAVYLVHVTAARDPLAGRTVGAIRTVTPLSSIDDGLARAAAGSGIRTDLIDATGHVLASSTRQSRFQTLPGYDRAAAAARDSIFTFEDGGGGARRGTLLFVNAGQWRVLTHADRGTLAAPTRAVRRTLFVGALLVLAALAIGLSLASRYVSRRVSRPATALAGIAEAVAAGDLSVDVADVQRTDNEIDRLSRATDGMIRELRRLAGAIRNSAHETAAMSSQITAGAEEMSASASEMAQTSNDLSRQSSTMAQLIRESAGDTTRLREISERLTAGAKDGVARNAAMRALAHDSRTRLDASVSALENLAVEVQTSATAVEALAVASEEIHAFVTLVHKVARQSKLLALNAAMEAARAGEHGQGFAVVATEVRRLAANSTEAAERTESLVRDIVSRIEESRGASARTVNTVQSVLSATRHGIESFGEIERAVRDAEQWAGQTERDATQSQELVGSTSARFEQLAKGTDQFAAAMEEVAASSEQQSASTEEIAAAAQSLAHAAERLSRLVSTFRLGDEASVTADQAARPSLPPPRKTRELVG